VSTSPVADLVRRFRFHETLLAAETEGFTQEDWDAPAGERGGNPARWILAHVTCYRRRLCALLGEPMPQEPWEAAVSRGAAPGDVAALPSPADLASRMAAAGEVLGRRLRALTEAEGAADAGQTFPDGGRTVADAARFLQFHETYHLGQIGLIRRLRGRAGFA
jgi:hypothetical protein